MKDKNYPNKLTMDLNRLGAIPVGRITEIPDNKSFKRTMTMANHIETINKNILKLERTNKKLLSILKKLLNISFNTDDENYEKLSPILDEAREAIAKAEANNVV